MRILLISLITVSFSIQAQNSDPFDRIFNQMEKQVEEMMKKFGADPGMRDLFDDDFSHFGMSHSAFDYHYNQGEKGRTLILKPHTKENNFKITIKDNSVQISGEVKTEKVEKSQYGESKSVSIQSVNQSLPVPKDTDGGKNKITSKKVGEVEEIHIFFPYKKGKPSDPGFLPESRGFAKKDKRIRKKNLKKYNDDGTIPLFKDGGPSETI